MRQSSAETTIFEEEDPPLAQPLRVPGVLGLLARERSERQREEAFLLKTGVPPPPISPSHPITQPIPSCYSKHLNLFHGTGPSTEGLQGFRKTAAGPGPTPRTLPDRDPL